MKKILTLCSVAMMVAINASDNKSEPTVEAENNNVISDMQSIQPEVLPIEVDKIKKQRIERSIKEKKYVQSVLKNQKSNLKNQKDILDSYAVKNQRKDALERWSLDARSKIPVITVKSVSGEKAIKLPSALESN